MTINSPRPTTQNTPCEADSFEKGSTDHWLRHSACLPVCRGIDLLVDRAHQPQRRGLGDKGLLTESWGSRLRPGWPRVRVVWRRIWQMMPAVLDRRSMLLTLTNIGILYTSWQGKLARRAQPCRRPHSCLVFGDLQHRSPARAIVRFKIKTKMSSSMFSFSWLAIAQTHTFEHSQTHFAVFSFIEPTPRFPAIQTPNASSLPI